jgi:RNA polymerase sigma-70 factor (ECF subfamily)
MEQLAREYGHFLQQLARNLCRGHHDEDDLVQETLAKTLTQLDHLPEGVNHRAWMTQVMKNLFIDQLRRAKTRHARESTVDPETVAAQAPVELPWWHSLDAEHVRAAAAQLPDELRETFERFAFRNESYDVIASAQGIPKQTVGTRIFRARRRIKALLEATARGGRS